MKVQITDTSGSIIWERDGETGLSSRAYPQSGTQDALICALRRALTQAEAELLVFDNVDRVPHSGATTA
jgi:hypothetical protein